MDASGLLFYKIESIAIIFVVGLVGGLLPLKRQSPGLLALGNCFSGGIFLAASILHMFPEAVEGFESFGEEYEKHAFIYFLVGIIIPFFVERVLVPHSHSHSGLFEEKNEGPVRSTVGVYLLMLMLSIHSFIEGVALGVQSNAAGTSTVMWAIVAHKFFAAFALGISLVKGNLPFRQLIQIIIFFSLTTPIGAGMGLGLSSVLDSLQSILSESVKAIASGTFVYVALMEVLAEEFGHPSDEGHSHVEVSRTTQFKKFILVVAGMVLMGLASLYSEHSHGHGHKEAGDSHI